MVKILSIASGKGGVGKTTAVANIGTAIVSHFNKRAVVIDCNLTNPHLGLCLGGLSTWPVTLNNVLKNQALIEQVMYEHSTGLKIIPASFETNDLRRMNMYRLRSRIKSVFEGYDTDIVILDSAPGMSKESLLTMRAADEVVFVATPHTPSVVDIAKTCQLLKETDARPVGIILNRVKNKSYELGEKEITKFTSLPVLARVPESDAVLKSTNFKTPVISMEPKDRASKAFLAATEALLYSQPGGGAGFDSSGDELSADYLQPMESGFFSRLMRRFRGN
jgi:septum site-determining protein MinD